MEMEPGKLFVGGISWDTSEDRLREYFQTFGEVIEAVIMKDRATGRARGFGFVVFADASVAETVVRERHIIDGRTVEAKKAVPRDDHQNFSRSNSSTHGSPGPNRTKKIFVGGLASSVTESDFKRYFDQFGTITDVVVMYDHNTQRPRGFGFITYDSEEAVDKVLLKTFHELNGKMVEVKRAVPKELSPGPTLSPSSIYNSGLNRMSPLLNAYTQGYSSPSSAIGYGVRMDGRFSPAGRSGYPPQSPTNYNMGMNLDSLLNSSYRASGESVLGYGQGLSSYFSENLNQFGSPTAYERGSGGSGFMLNTNNNRDVWGSGSQNFGTKFVNTNGGFVGNLGIIGEIWGNSPIAAKNGLRSSRSGNIVHGLGENSFGGRESYVRNNGVTTSPYSITNNVSDVGFGNLYGGESFFADHAWKSSSAELEDSVSFGYGSRNAGATVAENDSVGYHGGYTARSDRGIAT